MHYLRYPPGGSKVASLQEWEKVRDKRKKRGEIKKRETEKKIQELTAGRCNVRKGTESV